MMNIYQEVFEKLKNIKVLLVGETIIDEYCFVEAIGRATKDPVISTRFKHSEKYAGGVLAPARHLSELADSVHVVSLIGDTRSNENYISKILDKSNITYDFFVKPDSPTIIKRRFLAGHSNKIFKMEYINDAPIDVGLTEKIKAKLEEIIPKYDVVLVTDFGHGFLNDILINVLQKKSKFLAVNVQTNSSNFGFNLADKYPYVDFLSLNHGELRILFHSRDENLDLLLKKMISTKKYNKILLTKGKDGITYFDGKKISSLPAFNTSPIDTIGAGDAVFGYGALMAFNDVDPDILTKISNAVGAVAVSILGNKEKVKVKDVLTVLKRESKGEKKDEGMVRI